MQGYHWKNVCQKLIEWNDNYILSLLDVLLHRMGEEYQLSYDRDVQSFSNELVQLDPIGAWGIIAIHFEETLPKWRMDLLNWLKGGLGGFDGKDPEGAIIDLPLLDVIEWVEFDPESRASLIAHASSRSLDDVKGGDLTRELLHKYGHIDGVQSGIHCNFHSGGWSGPTSIHLKGKRDKFRRWLGAGFEVEVIQWIESEIENLDRRIEQEEIAEERSRFD